MKTIRIVNAIKNDLLNRRGFRQTWENMEKSDQEDMIGVWLDIVSRELKRESNLSTESEEAGEG